MFKNLVPNFFDKEKDVIHYENLQLYLKLGLKLKKLQRVLEFIQSQWLKQNVESNKQKRIEAEKKWWQRWKNVVQINGQYCILKNNGQIKK